MTTATFTTNPGGKLILSLRYSILIVILIPVLFAVNGCNSNNGPTGLSADAPSAPLGITVTPISETRVNVAWIVKTTSKPADGFIIQRQVGDGSWDEIGRRDANGRVFADTSVGPEIYTYRVIAYNAAGNSEPSKEVTINMATAVIAPTRLTIVPLASGKVEVRWADNSDNETGFRIQRVFVGDTSADAMYYDSVAAGVTSYVDESAPCARNLAYRVAAVSVTSELAYSSYLTVATPFVRATPVGSPAKTQLTGISLVDAYTAIAVGYSGTIIRTDDGGNSWVKQSAGNASNLNGVCCVNGSVAYIAGDRGRILKTIDGGQSWQLLVSGKMTDFAAVQFFGPDTGYVAGDGGVVLKTVDGGATWTALASGILVNLRALKFTDPWTGYVAGVGGVMARTVNGGQTWSTVRTGVLANLEALVVSGDSLVLAVGAGGLVIRSVDQGTSWATQRASIGLDLNGIAMVTPQMIVACGESGAMSYTINGGLSWTRQSLNASATTFMGISVLPNGTGFMVGSAGAVVRLDGCN